MELDKDGREIVPQGETFESMAAHSGYSGDNLFGTGDYERGLGAGETERLVKDCLEKMLEARATIESHYEHMNEETPEKNNLTKMLTHLSSAIMEAKSFGAESQSGKGHQSAQELGESLGVVPFGDKVLGEE